MAMKASGRGAAPVAVRMMTVVAVRRIVLVSRLVGVGVMWRWR